MIHGRKERKKEIIELDDYVWISQLAFFVDVTGTEKRCKQLKMKGRNYLKMEMFGINKVFQS
jgi:hypothetical protein